ncbi:hypothetical protein E1B28_011627 [Marasmius oreades]|uniref:DUF659 domain-containing protein n=1 Tax=Marasmius oreades TaxID=181124 RepID=A0A9P7UQF0_9AGAR|nr:uncharacterized protein E1B28_011627 [Marasmius oreades]KAG7090005.1 hypothetical protein E1B28_011627 [Marasmius oreades]
MEEKWKVEVIGFTTDASGKAWKAHHLLTHEYLHIVVPDCYAHQINLIVGDYFKVDKGFLTYSHDAMELITWLRSKRYVLALICRSQIENRQPVCTVIQAVLTRWTAHYLAFLCLLELQPTLQFMAHGDLLKLDNEHQLVTGNKKAKEKGLNMI